MLAFNYGSWCDLRDIVLAAPSSLSDNTFRYLLALEMFMIDTLVTNTIKHVDMDS